MFDWESMDEKYGHNVTTYSCPGEERAEALGLLYEDEPESGCWNCIHYDPRKEACTLNWNNADESYYNPDIDDRKPDDYCEMHETDPDADWEDWFGGDE